MNQSVSEAIPSAGQMRMQPDLILNTIHETHQCLPALVFALCSRQRDVAGFEPYPDPAIPRTEPPHTLAGFVVCTVELE